MTAVIHDYINFDDLLSKLGYKIHTSKLGSLGRAILTANKNYRSSKTLKGLCNSYYQKLRQQKRRRGHK